MLIENSCELARDTFLNKMCSLLDLQPEGILRNKVQVVPGQLNVLYFQSGKCRAIQDPQVRICHRHVGNYPVCTVFWKHKKAGGIRNGT